MKRLSVCLALLLCFSLAGCGEKGREGSGDFAQPEEEEQVEPEEELEEEAPPPEPAGPVVIEEDDQEVPTRLEAVDGIVTLTIPSFMNDGSVSDTLTQEQMDRGYLTAEPSGSGSITYTITQEGYLGLLEEMKLTFEGSMEQVVRDYRSIKGIRHNPSFSHITLVVDPEAYVNSADGLAILNLYLQSGMYQLYSGVPQDALRVTIDIEEQDTGELLDTFVYPE